MCAPKTDHLTPLPPPCLNVTQAKEMHIDGNLAGDGLQNGGMVIARRGGSELLLYHCEEVPGDHVPNRKILECLGIDPAEVEKL